MPIQKITEDRYRESVRLSEYAFQYKVPEEDLAKRLEGLKKHQILGVLEHDLVVAKLHLLSLETYVGNKKFKMGGIAGVATYPEYRRRGYVKEMLSDVLVKMREQGFTVSMLHPFDVSFYRKFGWELYSNRLTTKHTKSDLDMLDAVDGEIKRFNIENVKIEELSQIYEQYATKFSGMLVRDPDWWKNVIDDLHIGVYYDSLRHPTGYLLYSIKDNKMSVEEFVAIHSEARRGLWNFICQHDSMIAELELNTYEREPLFFALKNQRTVKREVSTYFMVRIVDVEAFLKKFEFASNEEVLKIQITDPYASWNEKTFSIKNQQVSVVDDNGNALRLSVNALSTLLFGYQRPTELYQAGAIQGAEEEVAKLEKLIPHFQGFMYDFF
ncbi:enhanced intracellular survival protein Eis [Fredinandcohnia humi]